MALVYPRGPSILSLHLACVVFIKLLPKLKIITVDNATLRHFRVEKKLSGMNIFVKPTQNRWYMCLLFSYIYICVCVCVIENKPLKINVIMKLLSPELLIQSMERV